MISNNVKMCIKIWECIAKFARKIETSNIFCLKKTFLVNDSKSTKEDFWTYV